MKHTAATPERDKPTPAGCPVVVVAASAGGYKALTEFLSSLPSDFPAAIALAQHRSAQHPDLLIDLLRRRTTLAVRAARDGEPLERATVYVCPAGMHMTAARTLQLFDGPKLNHVRPSADLLFVSLARAYGRRAIGVVLSGTGTDGAIGSKSIVDAGGIVVAQDLASADFPDMPAAAAALGPAQFVVPPVEIGALLRRVLDHPDLAGRVAHSGEPAGDLVNRSATSILLVDDHQIVLDGLRALLGGEADFDVVPKAAEDGRAAVRLSAEFRPDVVVMDLAMPGLDGVAATRKIVERNASIKVIALSAHTDARTTERVLRAGASAVLSKQKAFDELPAAIRAVMSGRRYVSRRGHPAEETPGIPSPDAHLASGAATQ